MLNFYASGVATGGDEEWNSTIKFIENFFGLN